MSSNIPDDDDEFLYGGASGSTKEDSGQKGIGMRLIKSIGANSALEFPFVMSRL